MMITGGSNKMHWEKTGIWKDYLVFVVSVIFSEDIVYFRMR